jgi:hypothetical protein
MDLASSLAKRKIKVGLAEDEELSEEGFCLSRFASDMAGV